MMNAQLCSINFFSSGITAYGWATQSIDGARPDATASVKRWA
jgi:hypothetical protein